jgi:type I restriction enzyme S subunit
MSWPKFQLSEVAQIERISLQPEHIPDGIRYLGLENIASGGCIIESETVSKGDLASSKFRFGPQHVLYGKLRPYLAKIALPDFEGICSTDILPIKPGPRIDRDYLAQFLRQPAVIEFATSRSTGANLPRLSPKALGTFEIPLPPLEEQKRIAAILDQADALRRLRARALARLDALGQAIFHEMFGNLWGTESIWPMVRLGEDLTYLTSGSRGWAQFYADEGAHFIRIQNVRQDRFDATDMAFVEAPNTAEAKRTKVRPGDLLLSITADLGRTAIVPNGIGGAYINQHLAILRTNRFLPKYLSAAIASSAGQHTIASRNRGGVKAGLNFDDIRSFEFPLPPQSIQREFCRRLEVAADRSEAFANSQYSIESLFASLQHRAFQGELLAAERPAPPVTDLTS